MKSDRRRFLYRTAALIHAGALSALTARALARGVDPQQQGIRKLSGDVRVNGQAASLGTLIKPGDTVATGPGAEVIYVVGQDAYLQRESTIIALAKSALRVISGKLLSVFGKGDKQILVPTATIGIRGTGCYIETEGGGAKARTYFCLCYGTADVTPNAAPEQKETLRTRHHEKPQWIHNDAAMPRSMVAADVINHSDLELEMLEALVGRVPPFQYDGNPNDNRY
jgi:hypothetical protein